MFGAAIHLQTRRLLLQPSGAAGAVGETQELLLLRYQATQCLNKAMQDTMLACTDETICAVVVLACSGPARIASRSTQACFEPPLTSLQWLDIYATIAMSELHFQGLERLIEMRGGLASLEMDGVADVIVT